MVTVGCAYCEVARLAVAFTVGALLGWWVLGLIVFVLALMGKFNLHVKLSLVLIKFLKKML